MSMYAYVHVHVRVYVCLRHQLKTIAQDARVTPLHSISKTPLVYIDKHTGRQTGRHTETETDHRG